MLRVFAFIIISLGCLQSYNYAIASGYTKAIKNNKLSNAKIVNGNKAKITNNNVRKRTKIVGVIGDRLPNDNNKHDYSHWPIYAMRYQYIDNFAKVCKDNNVAFVMLRDDLS